MNTIFNNLPFFIVLAALMHLVGSFAAAIFAIIRESADIITVRNFWLVPCIAGARVARENGLDLLSLPVGLASFVLGAALGVTPIQAAAGMVIDVILCNVSRHIFRRFTKKVI